MPLLLSLFQCYGDHRDLHSFPTRRSSDLTGGVLPSARNATSAARKSGRAMPRGSVTIRTRRPTVSRSEEHTSELQSLTNLVCRLLLEKKKTTQRWNVTQETTHHSRTTSRS